MNEEESLEEQLNKLVAETCQHPQRSVERERGLTKLIRIIQRSDKKWKDSSPDALQQTWLYFCGNLCEATTAKSAYDPQRGVALTTWLNAYLQKRLLDWRTKGDKKSKEKFIFVDNVTADGSDIIDKIPSPESKQDLRTFVCTWIKNDPDGKFKGKTMPSRTDINAQIVCLKHLCDGKTWQNLSIELRINYQTLTTFYKRHCIRLLREIPEIDDFL